MNAEAVVSVCQAIVQQIKIYGILYLIRKNAEKHNVQCVFECVEEFRTKSQI